MSVDSALRASLRAQAREFAGDVLAHARAVTDPLPTATERYRATRPFYRQMVEAGFLRRLIPQALGGDGTGASATAALAEELVAGDPSVALNMFSTGLGLAPLRASCPLAFRTDDLVGGVRHEQAADQPHDRADAAEGERDPQVAARDRQRGQWEQPGADAACDVVGGAGAEGPEARRVVLGDPGRSARR
jgi:alkylation response protein AidB-like acyl-CoA dehydrogenase